MQQTTFMKAVRSCAAVGGLWVFLVSGACAQDFAATESLTIPVRVVDGHLVTLGFIANRTGDINDLSLEISFEVRETLIVHSDMYEFLNSPAIVKLVLKPDIELMIPGQELRPDRSSRVNLHNTITRLHASELDDHKLKGVLGIGFLKKYRVVLDVSAGTLTLYPRDTVAPVQGEYLVDFQIHDERIWMPVSYEGGRQGHMVLGGNWFDTFVDADVAGQLGKPAGNLKPVILGGYEDLDLSEQIAFRPRRRPRDMQVLDPHYGAEFVAGVNFLDDFRVEVDWLTSRIGLSRTRAPVYPQSDFDYFKAEIEPGAEPMLAYLRRYPSERLSHEAARTLMDRRLEESKESNVSDEAFLEALGWIIDTSPRERRMEFCVEYVRQFMKMPGRWSLVVQAGKRALEHSREAITVQETYVLHNAIGEAYFEGGEYMEAWKHFLSAAFMPLDERAYPLHNIVVQYNLARAYDRMGRASRAYSRYVRTQEMLEPIKDQLAGLNEEAISQLSPLIQRGARLLHEALTVIPEALTRLQKEIPADDLELLEG